MKKLNECQEYAILKFLERYDYDAVIDILEEADVYDKDLYLFVKSCCFSINFEFRKASKELEKMNEDIRNRAEMKKLAKNIKKLEDGEPEAILSELISNIKIQIINEEYIDFVGRIYRLKEALFKYMFFSLKNRRNCNISMHSYIVSKKNILCTLKKKYNIYNANLIHGVTLYINRYIKKTRKIEKALDMLNSDRVENLIRMRNDSPVGHGFRGISKEEIERVYSNPLEVLQDFIKICELLDLEVDIRKYDELNETIIYMMGNN